MNLYTGDVIMTKKEFENYRGKNVICDCCKSAIDARFVSYRMLRKDGTLRRCPLCDWVYRHEGVPKIAGFSEKQVMTALGFIIFQKSRYVNDLSDELCITLDDAIVLVKELHVGNKNFDVKTLCANCGAEVVKHISVYEKYEHLYCSRQCYWEHKKQITPRGLDNPESKRIKTSCTNCGKDILVIPYDYNKTNKFGDNHNFCSQECYWSYRRRYYVGCKAACYGIKFSEERLEKMKNTMIANARCSIRLNSGIQLVVNRILDESRICYTREYVVGYYAIDNYLNDYGLVIEVMGDYWHASPLKYNIDGYGINSAQRKTLQHDKQKSTYIRNHLGKNILYLWESDIKLHLNVCKQLISQYILTNGILDNYHSFNYCIENDTLKLIEDVVVPYQDMRVEEYKHLFVDNKCKSVS